MHPARLSRSSVGKSDFIVPAGFVRCLTARNIAATKIERNLNRVTGVTLLTGSGIRARG